MSIATAFIQAFRGYFTTVVKWTGFILAIMMIATLAIFALAPRADAQELAEPANSDSALVELDGGNHAIALVGENGTAVPAIKGVTGTGDYPFAQGEKVTIVRTDGANGLMAVYLPIDETMTQQKLLTSGVVETTITWGDKLCQLDGLIEGASAPESIAMGDLTAAGILSVQADGIHVVSARAFCAEPVQITEQTTSTTAAPTPTTQPESDMDLQTADRPTPTTVVEQEDILPVTGPALLQYELAFVAIVFILGPAALVMRRRILTATPATR